IGLYPPNMLAHTTSAIDAYICHIHTPLGFVVDVACCYMEAKAIIAKEASIITDSFYQASTVGLCIVTKAVTGCPWLTIYEMRFEIPGQA
ncbi:hypothetical protein CHS0354_032387, partial [Potamilus streckersoni]